jgi:hypothetical protein
MEKRGAGPAATRAHYGILRRFAAAMHREGTWTARVEDKEFSHTIDTSMYQAGEEVSIGFSMVAIPPK